MGTWTHEGVSYDINDILHRLSEGVQDGEYPDNVGNFDEQTADDERLPAPHVSSFCSSTPTRRGTPSRLDPLSVLPFWNSFILLLLSFPFWQ